MTTAQRLTVLPPKNCTRNLLNRLGGSIRSAWSQNKKKVFPDFKSPFSRNPPGTGGRRQRSGRPLELLRFSLSAGIGGLMSFHSAALSSAPGEGRSFELQILLRRLFCRLSSASLDQLPPATVWCSPASGDVAESSPLSSRFGPSRHQMYGRPCKSILK